MIEGIVCILEFGLAEHPVLLPDGTQTTVPAKDLPLYVVSFAQSYANYSIKLVGHPVYAEAFIDKIRQEETRQYQRNLIDIEIIGGSKNE